jgi:hypothetical protein
MQPVTPRLYKPNGSSHFASTVTRLKAGSDINYVCESEVSESSDIYIENFLESASLRTLE